MKKIILTVLLLLAGVSCPAQRRVIIEQDYSTLHTDMFVIEQPGGTLKYYVRFANYANPKDTLCLAMTRSECEQMYRALKELKAQYKRWTFLAKANNVKLFSKPFDVEFPDVAFEWKSYVNSGYGFRYVGDTIHRSLKAPFPTPQFLVYENGHCNALIDTYLEEQGTKEMYHFRVYISSLSLLQEWIRNCDVRRIDAKYRKLRPAADYDSIFK